MQKFVMKLIKKYNIDIRKCKNIKIKDCFCNNTYYKKIIDDDLPCDPLEKEVLKSVNYCGINKIKERIFLIKKIPRINYENTTNFSFEFLANKLTNKKNNVEFNYNKNVANNEICKNMKTNFKENLDILEKIILTNEKFKNDFLSFNNYFSNEIINKSNFICRYLKEKFDFISTNINDDINYYYWN